MIQLIQIITYTILQLANIQLALDLTIQVITYTTLQLANFQLALDLKYTNQNAYKTIQVTRDFPIKFKYEFKFKILFDLE